MKYLPVLLLAVSVATTGPEVICPSFPVYAVHSQDVVLRCYLEPQQDANKATVRWTHGPLEETVVLYRDGWDVPAEQNEHFKERASLSNSRLTRGNLSLTLSPVKPSDSGRYQCSFSPGTGTYRSCYVNLDVEASRAGDSEVVGSQEPVKVEVGQDAILPCHLLPPFDVGDLTVEWKRNDMIVHIYRSHRDYLTDQDVVFKDRTSMFHHEMTNGNISLKLTNVTKDDSGNYTCFVPKLHSQVRRGNITLNVASSTAEKGGRGDNTTAEPAPVNQTGYGIAVGVSAVFGAVAICIGGILCYKRRQIFPCAGQDDRRQQPVVRDNQELDPFQPDNNT